MRLRSKRTTIAGISAALAIIASAVSEAVSDGWDFGDIAVIAAAVALALQGIFSRDDHVSSEGTRAPKNSPRPD